MSRKTKENARKHAAIFDSALKHNACEFFAGTTPTSAQRLYIYERESDWSGCSTDSPSRYGLNSIVPSFYRHLSNLTRFLLGWSLTTLRSTPVELAAQQRTLVETNERDTEKRYRKFATPNLLNESIRIRVKYAKVSHTRPCCQRVESKFHSILSTTITFQRHFPNIYQHNLARNPATLSTYSPLPSLFSLPQVTVK